MKQVACLRFAPTDVVGAMLIDPILRKDDRGHFARAWCIREFAEHGIDFVPVEANIGFNVRKGTLRGLHFQTPRGGRPRQGPHPEEHRTRFDEFTIHWNDARRVRRRRRLADFLPHPRRGEQSHAR
ncbi:MAG: dTDP-4-dehydrorhamnose 3,5-epimerase family protein, partial [Acidobacteriia bacterium]|nr:dTDP-4-dehydrorhamnose 3,5-epimerase family protein [Terriglobia bacterium]